MLDKQVPKIYSFAELEKKKGVTADELLETLKYYAETGCAINPIVVLNLVLCTELSPTQREELREYARFGMNKQNDRCETTAAAEYHRVLERI